MASQRHRIVVVQDECPLDRDLSRMKGRGGARSKASLKGSVKMGPSTKDRAGGSAKDRPLWKRPEAPAVDCPRRVGVMTRAQKRKACMEDAMEDCMERYPMAIANLAGRRPGMNKVARICPPDPSSRPSFMEECSDSDYDSDDSFSSKPVNVCSSKLRPSSGGGRLEKDFRPACSSTENALRLASEMAAGSQVPIRQTSPSVREEHEEVAAVKAQATDPVLSSLDDGERSARTGICSPSYLSTGHLKSGEGKSKSDRYQQIAGAVPRLGIGSSDAKEVIEISSSGTGEIDGATDRSCVVEASHSSMPMVHDERVASLEESADLAGTSWGDSSKGRRSGHPPLHSMIGKRLPSINLGRVPIRNDASRPAGGKKKTTGTCNPHSPLTSDSKGHGGYDEDIFRNLLLREKARCFPSGYLGTTQPDIHPEHRTMMVNWLVEFSTEFGLQLETLFLGVAIMDRCLAEGPVLRRQMLQLLGVASMLVASKFEETQPPRVILQDCCEVADHTFTQQQILKMETTVLKIIHFQCSMPTVMSFLWHLLKTARADKRMERTAEHIACLSMMDESLLRFPPSLVAASAVLLASHSLNREPWSTSMTAWSGYAPLDLKHCVERLHALQMDKEIRTGNLTAIWDKYSSADHLSVALLPPTNRLPSCLYQEFEDLSVQDDKRR